MVKWRDIWTLELDDIFKSCNIGLEQRMKLIPKIQNSQMMDEVEVKKEVIEEWENAQKTTKPKKASGLNSN